MRTKNFSVRISEHLLLQLNREFAKFKKGLPMEERRFWSRNRFLSFVIENYISRSGKGSR